MLNGGAGNDNLSGDAGDDTYIFGSGFGTDTVNENESEGIDTISLIGGINPNGVYSWVDQYGDLYIRLVTDSNDQIVISAPNPSAAGSSVNTRVEKIAFSNGAIWDLTQGLILNDTDDSHGIHGSAQIDTIEGRGGSDSIYAYAGNDVLDGGEGNDSLHGGLGDDTLIGGEGTDNLSGGAGMTHTSLLEDTAMIQSMKTHLKVQIRFLL
ncbi:MAG: hypothetical protein KKA05_10170 [Alphaproteobacteria bacterium]|nr:hypothetical protein [Alphaproteobacteria bacterium]